MAETRHRDSLFPDPKTRIPAVLVVEDETLIRFGISDHLRQCGFRVCEAGTAAEAIEILQSGTATIDLVFSDIRMPGAMDGFGLAQWIRKSRPGLPILLTSGDEKRVATGQQLCGNEPFLAKPYDVDQAVTRIRALMDVNMRAHES